MNLFLPLLMTKQLLLRITVNKLVVPIFQIATYDLYIYYWEHVKIYVKYFSVINWLNLYQDWSIRIPLFDYLANDNFWTSSLWLTRFSLISNCYQIMSDYYWFAFEIGIRMYSTKNVIYFVLIGDYLHQVKIIGWD